jgi:hypothetical protein
MAPAEGVGHTAYQYKYSLLLRAVSLNDVWYCLGGPDH